VTSGDIGLHYLEYGRAGVSLVVVPGITSPAVTWEFAAEELARDFRVVVMDTRGRGLSDAGPAGSYTIPAYAADTAAVIEALDLERPLVLGHSMGARAAAGLAVLHPGMARAVVVADPALTGPGREPYATPLEAFVSSLHVAQAGGTADDMRPHFPTWTEEQLALRADWLATCDEQAIAESYANLHEEDFFFYWRRVPPPVLFLYGARSPAVPAGSMAEVCAANPAAEVVELPAAGHMLPWDDLEGFVGAVREFAARVRAGQ
jgi:N-formylmaleamate deformylase